ncbi:glyoxylase-like metal-dependent hydrolase (beta-lactamase superfamily II) [Mycetocola sp. CAN_C7]|uniref:MBL fold metallo-hydrolase n=1 Tax=Mycetocola sp. CAN_C7 TaxID=2787724 RepID=UPI0018C9A6D5
MAEWTEVADRVFHRRYEPLDISIGVVAGDEGLLVVDTRCNPREAAELRTDLAGLSPLPVRWVVNTHAHYDHAFGNQSFADALIVGHHLIPRHFEEYEGKRLSDWTAAPGSWPQYDWTDVVLTPPSVLVSTVTDLDIGGRIVRFHPLPPGHTDTDLVVEIPDARAWFLGDVIEESGPPMYGSGSFPMDWPGVLDSLAALIRPGDLLVPGHGAAVDRSFLEAQADVLRVVADGIRQSFERGEPIESAAERIVSRSRLPIEIVDAAILRGYTLLSLSGTARP